MGKKSDARAQRKALAQEKFEANKAAFVSKVNEDHKPRHGINPVANAAPRLAPHLAREADKAERAPKAVKDGSRFGLRVSWCITRADIEDSWSWGEARAWKQDEWDNVIHPRFKHFEKLTWQEIDRFSSDTGHKMHHEHELSDLIREAQLRWQTLDLEQYESAFRFRLGNTERVWGYIVQGHFHVVWLDRKHSIYPTEPS